MDEPAMHRDLGKSSDRKTRDEELRVDKLRVSLVVITLWGAFGFCFNWRHLCPLLRSSKVGVAIEDYPVESCDVNVSVVG